MIERGSRSKSPNSRFGGLRAAFIQPKKSGTGVRLLLDARPLNKLLQQDASHRPHDLDPCWRRRRCAAHRFLRSGPEIRLLQSRGGSGIAPDAGIRSRLRPWPVRVPRAWRQGLNPGVSAMQRVMTSLLDGCESVLGPDELHRRGGCGKAYLDDIISLLSQPRGSRIFL